MAVAVHCRGCGTLVAESASYCYLCKCPDPTCHASHVVPKSASPLPRTHSTSVPTIIVWTILAAVSLMFAAAAATGVALMLTF